MIKRISTILLAGIMAAVLLAMPAYAAGRGEVQFSDPKAKTGEEFKVTAKMTCGGQLIGDGKLVLKYDPEYLEFVDGTGAKDASSGSVTIFNAGTGSETELDYTITFKALKEGETEITVSDSESYLWNDQTLYLTLGSSKVKISKGGDSSSGSDSKKGDGPAVTVGEKQYRIVNDIPPVEIPQGFEETKINFNGTDVNALKQTNSGQLALYMSDGKEASLFLYSEEDGSFTPLQLVDISEEAYIILLPKEKGIDIPKGFEEVTLKFNDIDFPAWQNPSHGDYYLVYALNSSGEKELYLYENRDQTFQRFNSDLLKEKKPAVKKRPGWEGKVLDFIENHLKPCLIAMAALLFFMLILALILALKVRNRNIEIDDLYDELDGKRSPVPVAPKKSKKGKKSKKASKKSKKKKPAKKGKSPYDGYSDYDDYDDEYPMEEDLFGDDSFDAYEYDNYENDFSLDDDEDLFESPTGHLPNKLTDTLADHKRIDPNKVPGKKAGRSSGTQANQKFHVDSDDTFKLDFIDLDD